MRVVGRTTAGVEETKGCVKVMVACVTVAVEPEAGELRNCL